MDAYLYCKQCDEYVRGFKEEGVKVIDVNLRDLYKNSTSRCPVCNKIKHVRLVVEEDKKED